MCVVSGDMCNGFLYVRYRRRSRETSSHQKPQDTVQYKQKPDAVMTTKPSKPPPPKASAVPTGRSTGGYMWV